MNTINTMNTHNQREDEWNQWFAGLTDGDGCFYINKKEKTVSFEITTHTTDARVVYELKNKLKAGTVKPRSNAQAVRYRVKVQTVIADIVHRVNGKLHNPARVRQFIDVCTLIGIEPILATQGSLYKVYSPYIAGIIDSDGTVVISTSKASKNDSQLSGVEGRITRLANSRGHNQLRLKVTTSYKEYAENLLKWTGIGRVYEEKPNKKNKSPNIKYHWTVLTEQEFQVLYEMLKKFPLKSVKMHRLRLALIYFKYKQLGYHLEPLGTLKAKMWLKFAKSWYKYSY